MDTLNILSVIALIINIVGLSIRTKKAGYIMIVISYFLFLLISIGNIDCFGLAGNHTVSNITTSVFLLLNILVFIINYAKRHQKHPRIELISVDFDDIYIKEFLKFYKKDIYNFFPVFQPTDGQKCFLILKNVDLVGIIIYTIEGDSMKIHVDYTKPEFRNYNIAKIIYTEKVDIFRNLGVNRLEAESYHVVHSDYLIKMGFELESSDNNTKFIKKI